MLRALWFAVKVAILITVCVWVAEQPGHVRIEWMDYTLNMHMGYFLLAGLILILIAIFLYQLMSGLVRFPSSLRRYNEIKRREKGYRALTLGLTAVAAGDQKQAAKYAKQANDFMPDDEGLPLLLQAQSARLDGREEDAARSFVTLLEHKDAAFLGVRGLLQTALDNDDHETAQRLVRKALTLHPKQPWILKIAYDLALKTRDWDEASHLLPRLKKQGVIQSTKAKSDAAAILLVRSDECLDKGYNEAALEAIKKARRQAPDFVPAVLYYCAYHKRFGQEKKAIKAIEKQWKSKPHDTYVAVYISLINQEQAENALENLKHIARLVKLNPSNALAQREAGRAAIEAGLWGEAREYLDAAQEIESSAELYRLKALLEERAGGEDIIIREWLEKAVTAMPDKMWVCQETHKVCADWTAILEPEGVFNTLEWSMPLRSEGTHSLLLDVKQDAEYLIEAPSF